MQPAMRGVLDHEISARAGTVMTTRAATRKVRDFRPLRGHTSLQHGLFFRISIRACSVPFGEAILRTIAAGPSKYAGRPLRFPHQCIAG
jgi:hypothetical protein